MGTRFLVVHLEGEQNFVSGVEYLVVNGEAFCHEWEPGASWPDPILGGEDWNLEERFMRLKLQYVPSTVTVKEVGWYTYEPTDIDSGLVPDSYAERVAHIFFGRGYGMGSLTKIE